MQLEDSSEGGRPRSQCLRPWRRRLGVTLAATSTAILLALAVMWARSYVVRESIFFARTFIDPEAGGTGRYTVGYELVGLESVPGVVGLRRERHKEIGARKGDLEGLLSYLGDAPVGFIRRRASNQTFLDWIGESAGSWGTLRRVEARLVLGNLTMVTWLAAAPYWVLMLPWAVPPLWWAWCPPGRAVPRLTVRRILAAVAAAAVVLAGFAWLWNASATDRAKDTITSLGGYAALDVRGVSIVDLTRPSIGDAHLARAHGALASLSGPICLDLTGSKITDSGLVYLQDLSNLRVVRLGRTRVTPAGVARLRRALPHVEITD